MAIFDATKSMYLTAYAHLVEPVQLTQLPGTQDAQTFGNPYPLTPVGFPSGSEATVAELKAAFPRGMWAGPEQAAALLNADFVGNIDPKEGAPYIVTPWNASGDANGPYPTNVAKFTRHTGGFLGIGGTTVKYFWMIDFVVATADGEDGPTDDSGAPVPVDEQGEFLQRRWIEGFEATSLGTGSAGGTGIDFCRDSARHNGGMGMAYRGTAASFSVATTRFNPAPPTPAKSWERIYIRLRKAPANTPEIWKCSGFPSAQVGWSLAITPDRRLAFFAVDSGGTRTLLGTTTVQLELWDGTIGHDAWNKIDLLIEYDLPRFRVYRNGTLVGDFASGTVQTSHASSAIGNPLANANELYLDYDDWMCTQLPTRLGLEALTGRDWLTGTKIALVRPTQFSSNHNGVAWTGDFRTLLQNAVAAGVTSPPELTSTTALALLATDTDAEVVIDADSGSQGCVAFQVALHSRRGTNSGQLGYKLGSAAAVMAAITQSATLAINGVLFTANTATPSDQAPAFPDVTPLELRHEKGNDAVLGAVGTLLAQVEMVGQWGPEDYQAVDLAGLPAGDSPTPRSIGHHNAPYPRCQWAQEALAGPIAPYIVKGGTYVGNGTGQDLTFRAPMHLFFVRPLTGNTGGAFWLSPMYAPHPRFGQGVDAAISCFEEDPTFVESPGEDSQQQQYRVRIAGNNSQWNALGVTYQYIAVMDPGSRYMLNGVMANKTTVVSNPYRHINDDMVPDFAMFFAEQLATTSTVGLYAKHKGQANVASLAGFSVGALTNAINMATAGLLTTQANAHALASGRHLVYSLWRKEDGNHDTGEPGVVNFGTYIGDGSASRTINLSPATPAPGRRPLFAMVFAEAVQSCSWRDPSHTGTNSSTQAGTENTTGITSGGIDQFSVGSALNGNGVVYVYFVLYAGPTACNNGWGCNGEYVPVEPSPPTGGPWPPDPPNPEDPPGGGGGGGGDPDDPDLDPEVPLGTTGVQVWGQNGGQVCEVYTRKQVNLALARIGVSKQITNLNTDTGEEATLARQFVLEDVNTTLRDFDWSWATQYANLVLVGGTATVPVNRDWQYSYRAPNRLIKARRIVGQAGQQRTYDPNPIKFRLGVDATGPLVFCNVLATTDVPLVLEYTERLTCPAFYGDPLFRDALAWKFAHSFAMPLAKDSKKQEYCLTMYRLALQNAAPVQANESQPAPDGDAAWISGREG